MQTFSLSVSVVTAHLMRPIHLQPWILAASSVLILASCAGDSSRYPSLAMRDAELASGQLTPSVSPDPVAPVATQQTLTGIVAQARQSHQDFLSARRDAAGLAGTAQGMDQESNEYARALVAVSALSILRGNTASLLGNLDELAVEAATTFAPLDAINLAQEEVQTMLNEQDAAIHALSGGVKK